MSAPSPTTSRALGLAAAIVVVALLVWLTRSGAPSPTTPTTTPAVDVPTRRDAPPPPPVVVAPPPRATPVDAAVPLPPVSPLTTTTAAAREVLRGPWGSGPGQFGHRPANESSLEAPMSFAVTPDGDVTVLDQVNRRVQRFRDGRFVGSVALPNEAAQDVAATRDGRTVVLDRLGDPSVTLYDSAGRPTRTVPLVGGAITEGGAVTGLFVDADGVYVEREHRELVRLTDARGEPDPARTTLWGRPTRDGLSLLRASIADRARGAVTVSAASRANGAMDWSTTVALDGAVLHLVLLDGDRRGRVYLGAVVGVASAGSITDPHVTVVRLDRAGAPEATLRIPAPPEADELFRPLAINDDGHVFAMVPGPDGLSLVEYTFAD